MNKEIICPKCKGEGGKEIAVSASPNDFVWISDGDYMAVGWKECKKCNGTGKILIGDKNNG